MNSLRTPNILDSLYRSLNTNTKTDYKIITYFSGSLIERASCKKVDKLINTASGIPLGGCIMVANVKKEPLLFSELVVAKIDTSRKFSKEIL